ncbi:MAG: acyl esterase [Sphingobacteriaceae bacterium]|nr:MAG: acyl esterase [Sphingobacteriaceae bacterium]
MEAANIQALKKITSLKYPFRYSICTLVTKEVEYQEMLQSFIQAGFTDAICEFLYVDNSVQNTFDAYQGINQFLQQAQGELIIICHQDILINLHNLTDLENRIAEIEKIDTNWAIISNAGGIENNLYQRIAVHVNYADSFKQIAGELPQKVCSVDENFIVIKKASNLALSGNLSGFHLYGLDLCLIAELLGYNAYAIDFLLTHKSYGNPDQSYNTILQALKQKYFYFMRSRQILTTFADFRLSGFAFQRWFLSLKWIKKIIRKSHKIKYLNSGKKYYNDLHKM